MSDMTEPPLLPSSFAPRSLAIHAAAIAVSQIGLLTYEIFAHQTTDSFEVFLGLSHILIQFQFAALAMHFQVVRHARYHLRHFLVGCVIAAWGLAIFETCALGMPDEHRINFFWASFFAAILALGGTLFPLAYFDDRFLVIGFESITPISLAESRRFSLKSLVIVITMLSVTFAVTRAVLIGEGDSGAILIEKTFPDSLRAIFCCCTPSLVLFTVLFVSCWANYLMSQNQSELMAFIAISGAILVLSVLPLSTKLNPSDITLAKLTAIALIVTWHPMVVVMLKRYGIRAERRPEKANDRNVPPNPAPESPAAPLPEPEPRERESSES